MDENRFSKFIKPEPLLSQFVFNTKYSNILTDKIDLSKKYMADYDSQKNYDLGRYRNTPTSVSTIPADPKSILQSEINNLKLDIENMLKESLLCSWNAYEQFSFILETIKLRTGGVSNDELLLLKKMCREKFSDKLENAIIELGSKVSVLKPTNETEILSKMSALKNNIEEFRKQETIVNHCVLKMDECVKNNKIEDLKKIYQDATNEIDRIKSTILITIQNL